MSKHAGRELREILMEEYGIETHEIHAGRNHRASYYFGFEDERMGKCRVGDHNERGRYGYRWQIRRDIEEAYVDTSKGHRRFFFPEKQLLVAARSMAGYHRAIKKAHETD